MRRAGKVFEVEMVVEGNMTGWRKGKMAGWGRGGQVKEGVKP